ncbi:MAG TPA: EI24 domain-containing protein [Candidatus Sumerlaeota bacterium]|mgnify:CR=1 FL=1|nr:EI24 domain-containing protein [Candidatus Sumerlaeota bacterium]
MPAEFLRGAVDVWRGLRFLLGHPGLWIWALIPFTINVLLFAGVAWAVWHFAGGWLERAFFAQGGFWADLFGYLLGALIWIALGLTTLFAFVPMAALIASPFNDVLSEKVEVIYGGGTVEESFSLKALWRGLRVGLATSLRLFWVTLLLFICTLPLHLAPVIGSAAAAVASAAITIRFLALEFTSYSMDRRYYDYARRREFLRRNRWRTLGLGTMAFVIMPVPLLNALFIPVSAVAGTLLFCDSELRERG